MAEDMWTINLVCDGADEGEKHVQQQMDRDEICYFNLIEMIEHYGYTSVDYIYYRRKDGFVAREQDPQVMDMLEECESQKMVTLFVTKQRLATLAPTNSHKGPSKSKPNKTKVKVPGARAPVAMARGTRKQIIQSHDEYLSEEHIGQESHGQNIEASELHSSARGDQIDGDVDIEVNFHDESEDRVKRGKTKLKDIWNLPKGHRIVVRCNELDQPIGVEAGFLEKFLGMVARNGCLCSLSYKDWRLLIGKKEKNTDEQKNKKDILKQVKMRFLYPSRMEKWILRTIGDRWRQHKSNLKSLYFDEHKSTKDNHSNVPDGVIADQWIALVDNWMTQKAMDISKKNRVNCTKKKSTHTAGTKCFARNREELREKDPEKKNPHRAVLYLHTHQTKSEKDTNAHVGCLGDPVYAPKDGYCADMQNTKRKRVYSDPQNQDSSKDGQRVHSDPQNFQDSSMGGPLNDTTNGHVENVDDDDLQPDYGYLSHVQKVVSKETFATPSNFEASQYQLNKISKRPSASVPTSKNHRSTTSLSTENTMKVGTKVYLQRRNNRNKTVAMGKLVSCDPKQKIDGVQLGKEFWMVSVSFAMVEDEPLIRPYKNYKVLRDVEGVYVAWPSTFIQKIDM